MKNYLNSEEKQQYFIFSGFGNFLKRHVNFLSSNKKYKDRVKNLRMIKTYTEKVKLEMTSNLDKFQLQNLTKEASRVSIISKYTKEALREFEEMKNMESIIPVEKEDLLDLFCHCIEMCQSCKKSFDDSEVCEIKKILLKYGAEPLRYNTEDTQCPYQYLELEEV